MAKDPFCALVWEEPEADHCGQLFEQSAEYSAAGGEGYLV